MPLYESHQYEPRLYRRGTTPASSYTPFQNAASRAFLLWGEHCTECAAPDCFSTCELYQPRPDERCRRFEFGLYSNPSFASGTGGAAEVVFKRWALLSARGNATMFSTGAVKWMERLAAAITPVSNLAGRWMRRATGDIRFSYSTFALLERFNNWLRARGTSRRPDAFVFECYNPAPEPVAVRFYASIDRAGLPPSLRADQLPQPFQAKLIIPPGYFRQDIAFRHFEHIVNSRLPFGLTIAPEAGEHTHLVFLALDFVEYADRSQPVPAWDGMDGSVVKSIAPAPKAAPAPQPTVAAARAAQAKCVVFDLDNTLWSGVLLEGNVRLKPEVPELLRALDSRGILMSVASKNAHEHAHQMLVELGLEEYFLFPRINWGRKSSSLAEIAKDLDIGLDTFVFVDDNAFERDEVGSALPQVEVLDETNLNKLLSHPRLHGSSSAEAKVRRQMYRQAMVRTAAAQEFADDYIGFLRSCQIRLTIRPPGSQDLERVYELAQRTNQLNFSGTKYSTEAVQAILADTGLEKYVLECSDRYGSYGIVGFCIAERTGRRVRVADFMLSCRVQGKFIEQALFDCLVNQGAEPSERLEVSFRRTNRNAPAAAVLAKLGFDMSQGDGVLGRDIAPGALAVDFMEVTSPVQAAQC